MIKKHLLSLALVAVVATGIAIPAYAQNDDDRDDDRGFRGENKERSMDDDNKSGIRGDISRPELVGKVTAINGTTLTVVGKGKERESSASTTFTVNASNATILKGGATTTVSAIAVGDVVLVQGTINGSTIDAKVIHSGVRNKDKEKEDKPKILNNGQPVIAGKVTAVSSTTITVMGGASTTYTVNATNAKFVVKGNASTTISSIEVGDNVIVQGTVNGSSVVATTVIEKGAEDNKGKGFFGRIGNFFKSFFWFK
ncbi:MAG: DUF5666 domain-containing protein [Candidatus Paceibacterota bacterium]|jgi:hypothetical protein